MEVLGEVSRLWSPMLRRISRLRVQTLLRFGLDSSRFEIGKAQISPNPMPSQSSRMGYLSDSHTSAEGHV
jgi:hypothetical protein